MSVEDRILPVIYMNVAKYGKRIPSNAPGVDVVVGEI